jgi:hypothetical protein
MGLPASRLALAGYDQTTYFSAARTVAHSQLPDGSDEARWTSKSLAFPLERFGTEKFGVAWCVQW